MTHHLAPALAKLREQINARWPTRDKLSDGWIGDTAHSARKSDHNADWDSTPPGVVRALDIDEDLWGRNVRDPGPIAQALADSILSDPRVAYVIYEGRIAIRQARTGHVSWRPYTGVNAHKLHVHVSLRHGRAFERDESPWPMPGPVGVPKPSPVAGGRQPTATQREQLDLLGYADTRGYQTDRALHPDGDMGPITSDALQREYDMSVQRIIDELKKHVDTSTDNLAKHVNRRIDDVAGYRPTIDRALQEFQAPGRPVAVGAEVGHTAVKVARQDLRLMLFELEDGRKGVQDVVARTWMLAPDDATLNGFLDVVRFQGFTVEDTPWGNVRTWPYVCGRPGVKVQDVYRLGRQVEWKPEIVADAPADVEPAEDSSTGADLIPPNEWKIEGGDQPEPFHSADQLPVNG